jgi:hypothetical protein
MLKLPSKPNEACSGDMVTDFLGYYHTGHCHDKLYSYEYQ